MGYKRVYITPEERQRRIDAGLIFVPFPCDCFNRELRKDGASWDWRKRAWLLPDNETYEKWVRYPWECWHTEAGLF